MNVAIVLAVSNYNNPDNNLPASKKDGEIIEGIINLTNKYEKILVINDGQTSFQTKELLSNFFIELKGNRIEEFFFYYSGHGEFSSDEFYYLLSDFDNKKKNQTSLQNNEVDDLIRTLNPQIVVKVIDACQSGTSYIKESDVVTKYFNETKKGFNKCYFLNSSLSDQSSYQDDNLSFFTHSFVQSLKQHPISEIRYKDIIDFILDEFAGNKEQTPFFVIQAELTEKFCVLNSEFREYLSSKVSILSKNNIEPNNALIILDLVKENAKEYVDKDGALKAMMFCKTCLENVVLDKEIIELYDVTLNFVDDNNSLAGVKSIGKWLKDNNNDFFAKELYDQYYDEYSGQVSEYISGYSLLIENAPFRAITIELIGKYPNLKSYRCNVALLVSKRQLCFFYSILQYIESGWDEKQLEYDKIKWTYTNVKIADEESILHGIKNISQAINNRIKLDINIQFGLKNDADESDDDLPF